MGRCNTRSQSTGLIESRGEFMELGLRMAGKGGSLWIILAQEAVGVFIYAALPGALRIAEVHFHIGGHPEARL
jgi:hypothetical protein